MIVTKCQWQYEERYLAPRDHFVACGAVKVLIDPQWGPVSIDMHVFQILRRDEAASGAGSVCYCRRVEQGLLGLVTTQPVDAKIIFTSGSQISK